MSGLFGHPSARAGRRQAALATFAGSGATVAITVAQAFLLIPLCLRDLGTPLYGAWLGASELLVWIQLLDAGIPNLVTQRVGAAIGDGHDGDAARWASTGFVLLGGVAVALCVIGMAAAPLVTRWATVPVEHAAVFTACFRLGVAGSAALLFFNGCVGVARGVQRTVAVSTGQVAGAAVGLGVAVALLVAGWGLWALAIGLVTRAVIALMGGLVFVWRLPRAHGGWFGQPSRALAREAAGLVPSMAGASVGYLLANNTEVVLVTTIFGPVPAAVYSLTRRVIDGLRRLLDAIAWSVYGGFAHLVTARDRHRARAVLHEILSLRLAVACLGGAVAAAITPAFVRMLFGADNFGGIWLTAGFTVQMVLGGQSFLANYLYRASGRVREGSLLLSAEAVLRVLAMAAGLFAAGLAGAPATAAAVSLLMLIVLARQLDRTLPPGDQRPAGSGRASFAAAGVLAAGLVSAGVWNPQSWLSLGVTAVGVAGAGGATLWLALPATSRRDAWRWIRP